MRKKGKMRRKKGPVSRFLKKSCAPCKYIFDPLLSSLSNLTSEDFVKLKNITEENLRRQKLLYKYKNFLDAQERSYLDNKNNIELIKRDIKQYITVAQMPTLFKDLFKMDQLNKSRMDPNYEIIPIEEISENGVLKKRKYLKFLGENIDKLDWENFSHIKENLAKIENTFNMNLPIVSIYVSDFIMCYKKYKEACLEDRMILPSEGKRLDEFNNKKKKLKVNAAAGSQEDKELLDEIKSIEYDLNDGSEILERFKRFFPKSKTRPEPRSPSPPKFKLSPSSTVLPGADSNSKFKEDLDEEELKLLPKSKSTLSKIRKYLEMDPMTFGAAAGATAAAGISAARFSGDLVSKIPQATIDMAKKIFEELYGYVPEFAPETEASNFDLSEHPMKIIIALLVAGYGVNEIIKRLRGEEEDYDDGIQESITNESVKKSMEPMMRQSQQEYTPPSIEQPINYGRMGYMYNSRTGEIK